MGEIVGERGYLERFVLSHQFFLKPKMALRKLSLLIFLKWKKKVSYSSVLFLWIYNLSLFLFICILPLSPWQISAKTYGLLTYINIKSNWIEGPHVKWKTNKFLEDKIGKYLHGLGLGKYFLNKT